ncbi:MAG TPA: hypothetical protein VGT41_06105 [Candidatus Babeliales bacterium]|nr:hypothetical protein [Candidatus Babeliales bacterium]
MNISQSIKLAAIALMISTSSNHGMYQFAKRMSAAERQQAQELRLKREAIEGMPVESLLKVRELHALRRLLQTPSPLTPAQKISTFQQLRVLEREVEQDYQAARARLRPAQGPAAAARF